MQFAVGENVVHPSHGAGQIIDIEKQELVSGFHQYYVIEFAGKRLTIRVPERRVKDLGMRNVMSQKRYETVLNTLRSLPGQLPKNFKERRQVVAEMINSGVPKRIAEAVRDLTWRRRAAHLTKADSEQLSEGRERLIAEMSLARECEMAEARLEIDEALSTAVAAKAKEEDIAA
ncbi:MAG: CarD family transcriptional regulator [Caldilineaceae bacterium]|nr:hypothetical protein [Caldilineaceae bacterium]